MENDLSTYPMNRKTEPHNLPSHLGAAKFWYDETSYRASSNGKCENVPICKSQKSYQ